MLNDHDHDPTVSAAGARVASAVKPAAQLFFGVACDRPLTPGPHVLLDEVDELTIGRGAYDELAAGGARALQLHRVDAWMSTRHARVRREGGGWILEDVGSKNGTLVDGERVSTRRLHDGAVITVGQTLLLFRDRLPRPTAVALPDQPGLTTRHPLFAAELAQLVRVAGSPLAVLVHGETGTGKELYARALHTLSGARGAFVAFNCAALPASMLEGELFGYRKGAFSGAARDHVGLVRAADHGTLFLDEIGDLPAAAQAALLRVLQEREVLPLGETRPVKVDFRLVTATHHDLGALVARQIFRHDLRQRISDFVLELPPLRERREDLGLLVATLLARAGKSRARFEPEAALALFRHDWPGNVRELERALSAAIVLAPDEHVGLAHLPVAVREASVRKAAGALAPVASAPVAPAHDEADEDDAPDDAPLSSEDQVLRERLVALLAQHGGSIAAVARELDKDRVQIRRWIKRLRIDVDRLR
jgi:DNA-binding NtrC family response regulator